MIRWPATFPASPAIVVVMLALLSGCVTYTESTFDVARDRDKAEKAHVDLGLAYIQQERFDRARQKLNRALEINSDSAPATAAMGLLNQAEGEYELAEQRFVEALRKDSEFTRGRSYYGAFLFNQGRYEDALEQFREASQDTEYQNRAGIFVNLGRTASRLGKHEEAAQAYQRAMRLDRNRREALEGAITALLDADKYDEARPLYEQLQRRLERTPDARQSAQSLWAGIRLAREENDVDTEASLVLQLRNRFPESDEHRKYKALRADD